MSLLERQRRDLYEAEAELQSALRLAAEADRSAREAERVLREAWEASARSAGVVVAEPEDLAEVLERRATLAKNKQHAHRAVDTAATRVAAARLGLEAAEARARRLRSEVVQQETTVAAMRQGLIIAEQHLKGRRKALQTEETALQELRNELHDLAGS